MVAVKVYRINAGKYSSFLPFCCAAVYIYASYYFLLCYSSNFISQYLQFINPSCSHKGFEAIAVKLPELALVVTLTEATSRIRKALQRTKMGEVSIKSTSSERAQRSQLSRGDKRRLKQRKVLSSFSMP